MTKKAKNMLAITIFIIIVGGLLIYATCFYKPPHAPSPYVLCNSLYYYISNEEITKNKLDVLITRVKNNVEANKNNKDGDSNVLAVGNKIYEIKDTDPADSIAVERDNKFYVAYPYVSPTFYED